jgi:glycosyltransferase involved in cell wall biosynthesis
MQPQSDAPRIGYVLKRFPRFSETFILNELLAHEAAGTECTVFSLLKPPEEPRHARLSQLRALVTVLRGAPKGAVAPAAPASASSTDAALFSGKTPAEIAALTAKAAEVAKAAREAGISHLHAHFGSDATTVALLAARAMGGSFSFTAHARDIYHTYVDPEADAAMRRAKMRAAAFVVTVSDYNARHLRALCPEARVVRLYNGIDLAAFTPSPGRDPGHLIAVGRMVPKKGFEVLVEACGIIAARGRDFRLSLIGGGPGEQALSDRIARLGLADRIALEGPLPQEILARRLARAECAVLPCIVTESGDRDGLPTVLLEAMACGLPVVTTTVSGGPEIVEDGVTGHLCPPGDAEALAGALTAVLADRDRALAMGRAGRARAERLFDLAANAATLRGLLSDPRHSEGEAA